MKKLTLFLSVPMVACLVFTVSCVSKEVEVTETYTETEYRAELYTETENVVVDTISGEDVITFFKCVWYDNRVTVHMTPVSNPAPEEGMCYSAFEIPKHSTSRMVITYRRPLALSSLGVYDFSQVGHIERYPYSVSPAEQEEFQKWRDSADAKLNAARPLNWVQEDNIFKFDTTGVNNLAIIANMGSRYLPGSGVGPAIPELSVPANWVGASPMERVELIWSDEIVEQKTVTKEHQVPYQVEKQRTVMQTKKVPFWEAMFGE